ncbi:MAG TPA: helix-turn-helix domain-containing protein [Phycisphaerales bacterium]|nr:helix-turn-helix domain-containing protein [Phycisphaerales bacterium]
MQLMSIEDLAAYLGDSKRTIYKYIASGDCPPYIRITAKNIKFDRADVDAWLESKKVYPGPGGRKMSDLKMAGNAKEMIKNAIRTRKLPWSPRAQAVLKSAEKQARKDGFDLVGTEHILLGIVSVKDCLGAVILKNLGAGAGKCAWLYKKQCKPSGQDGAGKAELSDDIHDVVKCAYEQSSEWGHEYIGAEHLLAGILLAGKGAGSQILTDLDITLDKAREETRKLVVCPC